MAARFNFLAADVTLPSPQGDRELKGVTIVVRDNIATVRNRQGVIAQQAGVVEVQDLGNNRRLVKFDDDTSWHAQRVARGCRSCGGRR